MEQEVWLQHKDHCVLFDLEGGRLDVKEIAKVWNLDPSSLVIASRKVKTDDKGLSTRLIHTFWGVEEGRDGRSKEKALTVTGQPSTDNDIRVKRQKQAGCVFHGPDVIDKIVEQIREEPTMLPHLGELASFIEQTPPEDLRLPVPDDFYGRLCAASIAERVFRVAKAGENWFRSAVLAHKILNPPVADGSEDSFHHYWDALIYDPIYTFLGGFVRNTRNEAGESINVKCLSSRGLILAWT